MARKSRNKKRKRTRKRVPRRFAGLKKKLERGTSQGKKLVVEPRGEVKMSEVLTDFVEPYLESVDTEEDHHKLLMIAIAAWNIALLPEEEQQQDILDKLVRQSLAEATEELRAGMKEIVSQLIIRKKLYFAEYERAIIDYELTDLGDSYYLSVASTLKEKTS